jgi:TonB family protein
MGGRSRAGWGMAIALVGALAASHATAEKPDNVWTQLKCRGKGGVRYYPPEARWRRETGAVLLEYSVNAKGVPERIVVLETTAPESLQTAAGRLLSQVRCKPDAAWVEGGGPQQRLKINVLFQFTDGEPTNPIDAEAMRIRVSAVGSRDPRS